MTQRPAAIMGGRAEVVQVAAEACDTPARAPGEFTVAVSDGAPLFYRFWPSRAPSCRSLILVHRGHEHSGRFQEFVDALNLDDINVIAWDARGHGRSPGRRGHAASFGAVVKDLDCFTHAVSKRHGLPLEEAVVLGHSVGGVTVAAWVHDYAPPVRAMILVTPAFRVRLYVPLAIPGLRLLSCVRRESSIKSYVKAKMLTHDPTAAADYERDPLISRDIAVNVLLGLHDTSTRLLADAAAIRTPCLVLTAGSDWVVSSRAPQRFFGRLGSSAKRMERYEGMFHSILHERGRERPIADIREFVLDSFERSGAAGQLPDVDRSPPPWWKRPYWWSARLFLRSIGRLSRGISIGWERGFDSGQSLDHVYRNRADGITPLGRLIDRVYLDAPGWRGIRSRKANLERLMARAIALVHESDQCAHVLDVAAGPGRYVMDTILQQRGAPVTATLRDRDLAGLEAGRALADQLNLSDRVTFEPGDAFDADRIAATSPRPTIGIVSGLFELFPDNECIRQCLDGLSRAIAPGGYLIYTNQPWHPQLELIARVLTNREGKPWVMRCRSQAEMDRLAAEAGFYKIAMEIDEAGIFTVSLARRQAAANAPVNEPSHQAVAAPVR